MNKITELLELAGVSWSLEISKGRDGGDDVGGESSGSPPFHVGKIVVNSKVVAIGTAEINGIDAGTMLRNCGQWYVGDKIGGTKI